MALINNNGPLGRSLHLYSCRQAADIPDLVVLPDEHLAVLLVLDASGIDSSVIRDVADRLLSSGLVYLSVWGEDCERVHDIFDEVYVRNGLVLENNPAYFSTWHEKEPLADTLWFFLNSMDLDHKLNETVTAGVTVVVNNDSLRIQIQNWLEDLPALNSEIGLSG